jgi:hypothetical protein
MEDLTVVYFVADQWEIVMLGKLDDLKHMLTAEDRAHRVRGVDHEQELGSRIDQRLSIAQVDLELLILQETIGSRLDSKRFGHISKEGIAEFWYQDVIAFLT